MRCLPGVGGNRVVGGVSEAAYQLPRVVSVTALQLVLGLSEEVSPSPWGEKKLRDI